MAQFGYQFIECIKKIQYALYWVFSYHTGVMYNGHCSWTYSLNILVLEPTTLLVCDIIRWKDFEAYSESCFSGTTLGYSFIGFLVKLWKAALVCRFCPRLLTACTNGHSLTPSSFSMRANLGCFIHDHEWRINEESDHLHPDDPQNVDFILMEDWREFASNLTYCSVQEETYKVYLLYDVSYFPFQLFIFLFFVVSLGRVFILENENDFPSWSKRISERFILLRKRRKRSW